MPFANLLFTAPWLLGFLVALPVLWWLLRLTPPSPKKIVFPALALLRGLIAPEQTPARTPWWLLLLRLTIAALLILAFADPLLNPQATLPRSGDLLIAIDNDWAAARNWEGREKILQSLIGQAERENRQIILLPTAPPANGDAPQPIGPMAAKSIRAAANNIMPQPWPADWLQAKAALQKLGSSSIARIYWLNSGLGGMDVRPFFEALQQITDVETFSDATETPLYILTPPSAEGDDPSISVLRANAGSAATLSIAALGQDGHMLAKLPASFAADKIRATAPFNLPLDIRNQVTRFEIEGSRSAAATVLLDESWQHRPVGLIGDKSELAEHSLLSGLYYIDRAIKPFVDLHIDTLDNLLTQNMAVLIITDETELHDNEIPKLVDWIKHGGVLTRFAGDRLAAAQNPHESEILPVTLRTGDRAMGGALSWAAPQSLRDFPTASPFHNLSVPPDVKISRQILAEPTSDLSEKTWAALQDGTPLVTAKPLGQGLSVLFHVPAKSEWSTLPLSGLFVDMLRRIVDLSHGVAADGNFDSLPPLRTLNGFGDEQAPTSAAQPLDTSSHIAVGPQHPPGLYGTDSFKRAFNLGSALPQPEALSDIETESYRQSDSVTDLQPWLLLAAFILLLGDFLCSLYLRGILIRRGRKISAALSLIILATSIHSARAATDEKTAIELTSKTYLAYVQTGDRQRDEISAAGLKGLALILQNRTSLDQMGVTGVDPENDDLAFFPLLYWPIGGGQPPLPPKATQRVNDYLHHGGMILFDTASTNLSPTNLQAALVGIDIPPLERLPSEHVLKHSFYLLDDFPGRYDNEEFWLEPAQMSSHDGVATVLVGSNDWAGAWAIDANGKPMFACTPGGELQRERAYRFGVNLVMYALTGNYKSDQLHAQALLEKLRK